MSLAVELAARIRAHGPMPVADFMAQALSHPAHGYYMRRDPFGEAGDFITAPEISQMFGELLGAWAGQLWLDAGRPPEVRLVELGPGRGTLMNDLLRAAQVLPAFRAALDIHLVETSPHLRALQTHLLDGAGARWHVEFDDVPAGFSIIIANELFDALPVRQLIRTPDGWAERAVALDGADFTFATIALESPPDLPPGLAAAAPGEIIELRPAADRLAARLGARLAAHGGAALVIDYGHGQSAPGDTLQAVRGHKPAPVLAAPGQADLTAHVDFAALSRAARAAGARAHGPITQGQLLERLGIKARAEVLCRHGDDRQKEGVRAALERLVGDTGMGTLFKALALTGPHAPPPPGFDS